MNPAATQTRTTQRRYNRIARTYDLTDWFPERVLFSRLRKRLWHNVKGPRILEIGVGTGKNIRLYPKAADAVAIDVSPRMMRRAASRATREGRRVELIIADAQHLPFRDGSFDDAIASFVFCSVPDPVLGLREARRVLKREGSMHLVEHVRAPWRLVGWLMDILNPLAVRLSGANVNRDTEANVRRAGFRCDSVEHRIGGLIKSMHAGREPGHST